MATIVDAINPKDAKIVADKIVMIHNNMSLTLAGSLFGSFALSISFWGLASHTSIVIWISAVYLLALVRWTHHRSFDPATASVSLLNSQSQTYLVTALLSGILWGSTAVLFFSPEATESYIIILLAMILMVGGSMTSLSSMPLTFAAFALPTLSPIIITMFLQEGLVYKWSSGVALLYLIITLIFSRNLHRVISKSLELKYENIDLVTDLKQQSKAANKANEDKSRFLAAASHDLRQPLHAVNLFVETLESKLSTDPQKQDLEHIRQGLDSLAELFNALLDITKLESNTTPINKRSFPLKEMISKLVEEFSLEAKEKHLKLTMRDCDHIAYSDPILLARMIRNLISNAIRYTNKGSIEIYCNEDANSQLYIHVRDSGVGIPEEDHENIFTEFFQLHNPERDRGKGLGLGLAIVHRISQLLENPLKFTSELGKGSEFILQLQLGKLSDQSQTNQSNPKFEYTINDLHVLIIDNELEILKAMESILTAWGCHITCADSAEKALALIGNGYQPEFILSDYRLPGAINGCNLIKLIQESIGDTASIIITGDTGSEVIAEITAAGQQMLTKPIKPAQLRIAMTRLLSTRNPKPLKVIPHRDFCP